MGGCLSVANWSFPPTSINEIESTLDTGDIIWLAGKGPSKFMLKAAGTWKMFSRVGVLVRNGPGLDGLQLCVPQACMADGSVNGTQPVSEEYVTIGQLSDELSSGMYKQAAVSRLTTPLTEPERAFAFTFCNSAIGQLLNHKAQLCVSPNRRVFCNQLVADMLVSCGRVALVDSIYGPAKQVAGSLLQKPVFLNVTSQQPAPQGSRQLSDTPVTSFVSDKGTRTKGFQDVNDQQEVFYSVHSLPSADGPDSDMKRSSDNPINAVGAAAPVALNARHAAAPPTKVAVATAPVQHTAASVSA